MTYILEDIDGSSHIESMKTLLRITKYKDIHDSEKQIEDEVNDEIEKRIIKSILWIRDFLFFLNNNDKDDNKDDNENVLKKMLFRCPLSYMLNLLKYRGFIYFDKGYPMNLKITELGLNKIKNITDTSERDLES